MAEEPLSAEGADLLAQYRPFDAVEVLRHAVATGEPSAPDLLVRAYFDSGSWHAAVEWLVPLVEQGHVRFAGRLGVALLEAGHRERAEDAFRLAIASGEQAAANDLGILLRDEGRTAEAVHVLTRAADDGDPQAAANLVALHLEAGDLPAAAADAERYADESRPDTVLALAEVRAAQGSPLDAEILYRRAGELRALRAHTAYGRFLLTVRDDPAGAEREFGEAQRAGEPGWAATMARFLLEDGRPEAARPYAQEAAYGGDPDAEAWLAEIDGRDPADD